ncbi:MAG TPA: hypothetical protein VNA69_18450 [Thermoanaerobaculia bacterium]|nr:hypothetical protein [Thermoanaerobaculia bacterium]
MSVLPRRQGLRELPAHAPRNESEGQLRRVPAAFFLIPNDAGYRGSAVYVRTSYTF